MKLTYAEWTKKLIELSKATVMPVTKADVGEYKEYFDDGYTPETTLEENISYLDV